MARKSRSGSSRGWRRTRAFAVFNLVLWAAIGGWYLFQPEGRKEDVARLVWNAFDSRKQITAFDVAWDLWQLYGATDHVPAIASGDRTRTYAGAPSAARPTRLLVNTGYAAGYSDELGNPLWAAYRVTDQELKDAPPRPDEFRVDLRTTARIDPDDYARSGYDRGHLAPNYAIATRYGRTAQEETFLMSNIAPQKHGLNAGTWKDLEQRIATNYAGRFGEVWVVAGPIFGDKPVRLKRRVAVPEAFFMIVLDEREGGVRAQAFVFPQDMPSGADPAGNVASIDEIERRTGLDFFRELPDDAEARLEAMSAGRVW